jgi:L-serine dehydratase
MYDFDFIEELIKISNEQNIPMWEVVLKRECDSTEQSEDEVKAKMKRNLEVMREAIKDGLKEGVKSVSGLNGGDAVKFEKYRNSEKPLVGSLVGKAIASALAVSEINAAMGRIVAVPTAGSCGILPGSLLAFADEKEISDDKLIEALFLAAGIGIVIAKQASVSGAMGGCQAECGSASAMAAAAITYLSGGSNDQIADAVAINLKCILGLVCDPVAGLVEVPCIKRNAMGAVNAVAAADMAIAGIESLIPVDEVIKAMDKVGKALPASLKETSLGGLAVTPTGCRYKNELLKV